MRPPHVLRHGFSCLRLRGLLVLDRSHAMTDVLGRVGRPEQLMHIQQ
jgi:hypothetical protein